MSRATLRPAKKVDDIGDVIIAAWFKVLPDNDGDSIGDIDPSELSAAFSSILDAKCIAVIDKKGANADQDTLYISVPYPPVTSKNKLIQYLHDHYNSSFDQNNQKNPFNPKHPNKQRKRPFSEDFGEALFFGCGK